MKTGRDLNKLVREVLRQAEGKRDFLTPARRLEIRAGDNGGALDLHTPQGIETYALRETAHQQLAERLEIPKVYYDRMKEQARSLFAETINYWLRQSDKQYLIRTLDGQARAVLSDRYRVLDNDDLANVALPVLAEHGFEIQ